MRTQLVTYPHGEELTIPGALKTQGSGSNPWSGAPGNDIVRVVLVLFFGDCCVCSGMKRMSLSVSVAGNQDFKPGNLDMKG